MGRHSDSDEDRKKKKKSKHKTRSSSSDSITSRSSKPKKSKKSKHKKKSKSRSPSRRHKSKSPSRDRRRSRSRSVPKSYIIKSRSPSPYRSKRRSKSPSPYRSKRRSRSPSPYRSKRRSKSPSPYRSKRRSKSPSPYRSKRRSRSTSRSRTRRSKSPMRRSRSRSRDRSKRDRSRSREKKLDAWDKLKSVAAAKAEAAKAEKEDPCANIAGFDLMTTSQQSEARLQMALKAAAAAGEKLKEQGVLPQSTSTSFLDQERRAAAIESIESDAFTPMAFKSSRGQVGASIDNSHENAIFGLGDLTLTTTTSSELRAKDTESLMHPNLYISSEDKMQNWIQKLTRMRKRKLEGSAMLY